MKKLALTALETAINQYLKLDSNTLTALSALHPSVVEVQITDWDLRLFCQPAAHGLNLFDHWHEPADTVISGSLPSLMQVGLRQSDNKSLFDNKVTIQGDMELGERLRQVMRAIDIDWEHHLANAVGDTLAVNVVSAAEKLTDFIQSKRSTLKQQLTDFLQHEQTSVVTSNDLREFADAVTALRLDTDRAEHKISRLQNEG